MDIKDLEKIIKESDKDIYDNVCTKEEYFLLYDKRYETLYLGISPMDLLMKFIEKNNQINKNFLWEIEPYLDKELIESKIRTSKRFIYTSNHNYVWSTFSRGRYEIKWVFEV